MSQHHSGAQGKVLASSLHDWSFTHHGKRREIESECQQAQHMEDARNMGTVEQAQMVAPSLETDERAIEYVKERATEAANNAVTWHRDQYAQSLQGVQTVTLTYGLPDSTKVNALQALDYSKAAGGEIVTLQQNHASNLDAHLGAMVSSPGPTFLPLSVAIARNSHFRVPGLANAHVHLMSTTDTGPLDFSERSVAAGSSDLLPVQLNTNGESPREEVVLYRPTPSQVATQDLLRGLRYDIAELKQDLDELRRLTHFIYEHTQSSERKQNIQTIFTRKGKALMAMQDVIWMPEDLEAFSERYEKPLKAQTPDEKGQLAVNIHYNYLAYTALRHLVPVLANKNVGTVFLGGGVNSQDTQCSMSRYTVYAEDKIRYWRFPAQRLAYFMKCFLRERRSNALNLPSLELKLSVNGPERISWGREVDHHKKGAASEFLNGVVYVEVSGVVLDEIPAVHDF